MPNLLKKAVDIAFDKKRKPSMFLANFFKVKELDGLKVEVQSRTIKSIYSVDVQLGTGARTIDVTKYDKVDYVVPELNDIANITEVQMAEAQFGETEYEAKVAKAADLITDRQEILSNMQRRAEEKQAADALFNGKIVLNNGDKIEFNKLNTHTVDKNAAKWNTSNGNPVNDIIAACELCIDDGKLSESTFNLILEKKGIAALLSNQKFIDNSSVNNGIKRNDINIPKEMTPGATFHGQFSVGTYIINLWGYNEKYEIPAGFANAGTEVGYIQNGYGILLPENPNFTRYYGALNDITAKPGAIPGAKLNLERKQQMPYAYDVVENGSAVTKAGVKSRPLCVPNDINAFVTFKNLV